MVAKHRATLVENIVQELNEWHFDVFAGVVVASDRHMWSTLLLEDVNLPLGGPRKVSECALCMHCMVCCLCMCWLCNEKQYVFRRRGRTTPAATKGRLFVAVRTEEAGKRQGVDMVCCLPCRTRFLALQWCCCARTNPRTWQVLGYNTRAE